MKPVPAIIESAPDEARIKALWETCQKDEATATKSRLALGKALWELRERSEVVSGGTTFNSTLRTLGIPHKTAYRYMGEYEEYAGIRQTAPAPEEPPQDIPMAAEECQPSPDPQLYEAHMETSRVPTKPYYQHAGITIYHGDAAELLHLLGGDLVLTDFPYGVGEKYDGYEDTPENLERLIATLLPLIRRSPTALISTGARNTWLYPRP